MTGEIREALEAAIKPAAEGIARLESEVQKLGDSINGNGHPGLKGRLTRVETILLIVGALATFATSMASCAIGGKVIAVPTYQGSSGPAK